MFLMADAQSGLGLDVALICCFWLSGEHLLLSHFDLVGDDLFPG